MLRSLEIRDILIVDRLELEFRPGLNVLTGETGAGKSILLGALGFALGWRGPAGLVRAGAGRGEVTACFDLPGDHPARDVLRARDLDEPGELVLRRVNTAEGRKTAWVNDRRVSGDALRELSGELVELHGQRDDRGLLDAGRHRGLLDAYAGAAAEAGAAREAWRAVGAAREALDAAAEAAGRLRAEEEFLRHAAAELDALAPEDGEAERLESDRRLMRAAERIRGDAAKALAAMGADGAEGALGGALRLLEGVADQAGGRLGPAVEALGRAMIELAEAERGVAGVLEAAAHDPARLERAEERLFAIRALARKHGVEAGELGAFAQGLREKLAGIEGGAAGEEALRARLAEAEAAFAKAAGKLSRRRKAAAKALDGAMAAELPPLKMERAAFETRIAPAEPGPSGVDAVSFEAATNPGAPAGRLDRIASGGELSRFLLALKVCLSSADGGRTMIFDEIDRGVGGATADAVGRRLAALAEGGQVLVVTHSPQVAARGDHHWAVSKRTGGGAALTTAAALDPAERTDEIARMLSGDEVTEEARGAARALLGQGGG